MPGKDPTWKAIEKVREITPLVHCITNTVAANFAANAVIAVGGSPVMASEPTEVAQVTRIAHALTINIGTCTPVLFEAIKNATTEANRRGLPWVLDPVGVAATKMRQDICRQLIIEYHPAVIRGNASEIMALAVCTGAVTSESAVATRGLDSTITSESVLPAARTLAQKFGTVVAVSGKNDYVVDGKSNRSARVANGHPMMAQVTATGCSLTATLGAFLADTNDVFWSTVHGLSYYAVAGEYAANRSTGTGSMHSNLLDCLSSMTYDEYHAAARRPIDLSLYLVTDPKLNLGRSLTSIVDQAIAGGVSVVQLREKDCDSGEFLERAANLKRLCDEANVPLIINDRVDIALAVDSAGVHIGQDDLPVPVVRQLLGPSKVIGLSVSTPEEFEIARKYAHLIDYIGVGPVYQTSTKANAKEALGLEKLERYLQQSSQLAVAIGGINVENAHAVRQVPGVAGLAVVTAITMAEDATVAAQNLA